MLLWRRLHLRCRRIGIHLTNVPGSDRHPATHEPNTATLPGDSCRKCLTRSRGCPNGRMPGRFGDLPRIAQGRFAHPAHGLKGSSELEVFPLPRCNSFSRAPMDWPPHLQ